ncbi:pca operon transcription factor PcaQ [Microbulbifer taiwanensis]|uniref:Pca operon transcription factor PcaQ n=1 Tax=Microbulbifer taiwanensis TaxID=986746 RepID=A0ABW1YIJ4_9GAMM|nr:pca operon transcription factor PcaQ [Microbulbifer taiwanensis]
MIDHRIKFRHLQCFLEADRQRGIARAAEKLALTQPAVSKSIRELEDILGTRLMTRGKNGVALTSFGEVFRNYAKQSLAALRQGVDSIVQARAYTAESLAIGALPTVAANIMPQAVAHFRASGARASLRLISGPNTHLLEQLRVGDLDLVIGRLAEPRKMTGLSFTQLYSEKMTWVVRPGHPLLKLADFDMERIAAYPLLVPTADSITRNSFDQWLIAHGIAEIPDRIETVSSSFGRSYVRRSDAIWVISRGVVEMDIDEGNLAELPADMSDTSGAVGLTTRAGADLPAAAQLFMSSVRHVAMEKI